MRFSGPQQAEHVANYVTSGIREKIPMGNRISEKPQIFAARSPVKRASSGAHQRASDLRCASRRSFKARFIASKPRTVSLRMRARMGEAKRPPKDSLCTNSVTPGAAACNSKRCTPLKSQGIPASAPLHWKTRSGSQAVTVGVKDWVFPDGSRSVVRSLAPSSHGPSMRRMKGFQAGYAAKSTSAAQTSRCPAEMVTRVVISRDMLAS